jgi:hypothetical protein
MALILLFVLISCGLKELTRSRAEQMLKERVERPAQAPDICLTKDFMAQGVNDGLFLKVAVRHSAYGTYPKEYDLSSAGKRFSLDWRG